MASSPSLQSDPIRRPRLPRPTRTQAVALGVGSLGALGALVAVARATSDADSLSALAAVVLGLVEGLTEYLPVSSTGHLLVFQRILGLGGTEAADDALDTYAICIQVGAIAAVGVLYRRRLTQMVSGIAGRDPEGRHLLLTLIAAFVPTVVIALALEDVVRNQLFGPWPVVAAWIVGGLIILLHVRYRPPATSETGTPIGLDRISINQALIIGCVQALAIWPGMSRSLVTILAALALGIALPVAVEFSFLLGLATLSAATAYEALKNGSDLISTFGWTTPIIGLIVAFISALAAVRWMLAWLQDRSLAVFGWYRIAAGIAVAIALGVGWID